MLFRIKYFIYLFLLVFVGISAGHCQLDNSHFIPPLHARNEPGPQYLYLSTPSITPINISILKGDGTPLLDCNGIDVSNTIISNSSPAIICVGLDYGSSLLVNTVQLNRVLRNHGLVLRSNADFYVNLRIYTNNRAQAGSLTSKGRWARGNHFRIGHIFSNNDPTGHKCHIIGIMATMDNTRIRLTDFAAGLQFAGVNPRTDFILNQGECIVMSVYVDAINPINDNGLMGSLLQSSKPIFVNCGSWDGSPNSQFRDMGIDQITPMKALGNEYILIQGIGPTSLETPIVIADKNNTTVFINGSVNPDFVLNAGEWRVLPTSMYSVNKNMYIRANQKIAVYQMIGGENDPRTPGLNFMPALSCLGDSVVDNIIDISRIGSRSYKVGLMIVAEKDAWVNINDQPIIASASTVTGHPDYVTYRVLSGLSGDVKVSSGGIIQVGMYGFAVPSGFAGYFSGFENHYIDLVINGAICLDTIRADMKNITRFEWFKDDSLLVDKMDTFLRVKEPGWYQLVGYQCDDESDSSQRIWIGRPDTVYIDSLSCNPPPGNREVLYETNWTGCDSVIIINYDQLPLDSTYVDTITCDVNEIGIHREAYLNRFGCDSIVFKRNVFVPIDTTLIIDRSCFALDTGVYDFVYQGYLGCDSVVRYKVYLARTDTIDLYYYICDPNVVRVEEEIFENQEYCDSLVRNNYILKDSYFKKITFEMCEGQSIDIGTRSFLESTLFVDSLYSIHGCDSFIQYNLIFHPVYNDISFDTICRGDSIFFEGVYLYEMGIYSKDYKTSFKCDSSYQLHLFVHDLPKIVFNEVKSYCKGDEIKISTKDQYMSYQWSNGSNKCCVLIDTAITLDLFVIDSNGCQNIRSISIPEPIIVRGEILKRDVFCFGERTGQIGLNSIQGGDEPYRVFVNGVEVKDWPLEYLGQGSYFIQIIDDNGCSVWDTVEITAPEFPFDIDLERDTILRFGDEVELKTILVNGQIQMLDWYINGEKLDHDGRTLNLMPQDEIEVELVAFDPYGCMAVSSIFIKLYIDPNIYIPNVFSPNSDGINDSFTVFPNDHIERIELFEIYSRWGELLYKAINQPLNSKYLHWDGIFNGLELNNAVFVYHVVALDIKGDSIRRTGTVTLVR